MHFKLNLILIKVASGYKGSEKNTGIEQFFSKTNKVINLRIS